MTITNHPLHRSGRALLTHPAPALGDDAKSPERGHYIKEAIPEARTKQEAEQVQAQIKRAIFDDLQTCVGGNM